MFADFKEYLSTQNRFTEEDLQRITRLAIPGKVRRNEAVFSIGEISRHKIFIRKGLLRTFTITPDGQEHILQFSPEETWTLDSESYNRQIPSRFSIAAVEASDILLWHKSDFESLLGEIPAFKKMSEQIIYRSIYDSRQRMLTMLSGTPEERYADFVATYPGLLARLPLRMIAAYLGISLKTLTRVRHAQLLR